MNTYMKYRARLRSPQRFRIRACTPTVGARRSPRIGLALSGGGVKAVAHIGVLDALARAGLKFDLVAGTSAGALVGLFHCAGHEPDSMAHALRAELSGKSWWHWLPLGKYWRLSRLLKGGLKAIMQRYIDARRFEDLLIPFFAISTDLVRGEAVVHERGDVIQAVAASMSLPGLAAPVRDGERLLVDGGLLTYLPSEVLKQRGADFVVGVDLSADDGGSANRPTGALAVLYRSWDLPYRALCDRQLAAADVLIRPRLAGLGCADFAHMEALLERGREAGEMAVARIRALMSHR